MSAKNIDQLFNIWAATLTPHGDDPPFKNHNELYTAIDETPLADGPWDHATFRYDNPDDPLTPNSASWKLASYNIWFHNPQKLIHNMLANPDFANKFDYTPYQEYKSNDLENHRYHNLMSGNWAWKEAVSV